MFIVTMLFPHYIFTVDQIKYNHLQLTNVYVTECWSSISTSEIHKSYGIGLLCPAHDFIALSSSMINWIVDPDTAAEIPFIGCGNTQLQLHGSLTFKAFKSWSFQTSRLRARGSAKCWVGGSRLRTPARYILSWHVKSSWRQIRSICWMHKS